VHTNNSELYICFNRERFDDELHFEFNMSALIVLLKNNAEQNPHASYFNVDILKYQVRFDNVNILAC